VTCWSLEFIQKLKVETKIEESWLKMIAHTHRLVGEFLYQQLPISLREKIDHNLFVNGNVKPDIVKTYRKMSHYYRDNEEFVFNIFKRLMTENMEVPTFSDLLGILIHFLCDYTCIYHANDYVYKNDSIRMHMQYEIKFHIYAQRRIRMLKEIDIIPFQSLEEVRGYVKALIRRTNVADAKPDIEKDFNEMMILAVGVLFYILTRREPTSEHIYYESQSAI